MTPMIVVTTYFVLGLLTARLAVYSMKITRSELDGSDFVFLPVVVLFWWFAIWYVAPYSIQEWWENRENGTGRPEWLVNSFTAVFGIKE